MKTKIIVLGAGLIGKPLALDLATEENFEITVADRDGNRLEGIEEERISKKHTDLGNIPELKKLVSDYDLVVNATPGFMGFNTLKSVVEAGKNCIDIAFYPENAMDLDELCKKNHVMVISDIGVAPGMSNLLSGYAAAQLDEVDRVDIFVGGLPKVRKLPWEYKAVFSPTDVIEEYTRPARLVENGEIVVKDPLTEIETLDFDRVGTLEAFNSDGLRSLLYTIKAKTMREKTLRYPGYAHKIKLLADNGFFSTEKIDIDGKQVAPLELTSKLLFEQWKQQEGDEDITVMRIVVEGKKGTKNLRFTFDLYDEYDPATQTHSMARTTAYTASVAARMMHSKVFYQPGLYVPEMLGKQEVVVDYMLKGLADRNVNYTREVLEIQP